MADSSGYKSKQEITQMNGYLNFIKNEVLDALAGVPYMENDCTTVVDVRDC